MNRYKCENLSDKGYKQFYLTKKQHDNLFICRKTKWLDKYEYYYNEKYILLYKFINWKGVFIYTFAFPLIVLMSGLVNFNTCLKDLLKLYNQKKYEEYCTDDIINGTELYDNVIKIIKTN